MFGKKYEMSLGHVHDSIRIREGGDALDLTVDADPQRMVAALNKVQKAMHGINEDSTEEETRSVATLFAGAIFGTEQARKLMEFYHDDAGCVITLCGRYFADRLSKRISKAQKKQ